MERGKRGLIQDWQFLANFQSQDNKPQRKSKTKQNNLNINV